MAQMPISVLELVMDQLRFSPAAAGIVALEGHAADCFALSAVQRCNRRASLQLRGMRAARAAEASRRAMWLARSLALERAISEVMDEVSDGEEDAPLVRRVRRLRFLRRVDQALLVRIMAQHPGMLGWAMRQQVAIRAELAEEDTEEDAEEDAEAEEEVEAEEEQ